ncbi:hypothetical protein Pflav_060580 [Phytohabitans flavus]|uniref:Uncharacterized protein n=1 Tax=Phytohabitans flavus TaxID=1076124 RepID=A0A6F8Y0Z6_9ACTN|nr:hypothetical protein Pflav_060580 [Phytohabitans flavus]
MQVVELADAGDAGQGHLRVHRAGERAVAVRGEEGGDLVHHVPPAPERAAALDTAAQRTVERVRVGVGEAGQREPRQPGAPADGDTPGATAEKRPPSTSMSTSAAGPSGSQASSAW